MLAITEPSTVSFDVVTEWESDTCASAANAENTTAGPSKIKADISQTMTTIYQIIKTNAILTAG